MSQRAIGAVLCWQCRRRRFPVFPLADQLPRGWRGEVRPLPYGLWGVTLYDPEGTPYPQTGITPDRAFANARTQAGLYR